MSSSNMDDELRNEVWERDKGTCQICQKRLSEIKTIDIDPSAGIVAELSVLKEIPVFKWRRKCWKCGKETAVVSYDFAADANYSMGDIEKLDKLMMQKYPFIKKTYSETMGKDVIANTCVHCGSLQGNWFINDELIDILANGEDMNNLIDCILPNNLTVEDLYGAPIEKGLKPIQVEEREPWHIHHKDGNWQNNDIRNLILLCKDCHNRIHFSRRRNSTCAPSRKEAKEEARVRKGKAQADRWRKNYYAIKKLKEIKKCR